ncbi:S-methyl thiohydantoin desulfurase domain-containing protein [Vibrio coralliilyticus]|uniref:S-methyl thiohydantoin desulfurase domain-containing protein n=1 Tax=Vibrio coralliilyticus TaxID=190893 RepID=UPI00148E1B12|nr:DUF917 family protein [Vibrio coralliilyticus]NOI30380.1 DUF917 family protein [Vibrio coralliilyticus]NOI49968.1 DUF917 family protein [Vibrio coralliilyticus]
MELAREDLFDIASGATLLASGGGGSIQTAYAFIQQILTADHGVQLVDMQALEAQDRGAVVAAMGSPESFEKIGLNGAETRALSVLQHRLTEPLTFVVSVETGSNLFVAMLAAISKRGGPLKVLNADGANRSVPTLSLLTFSESIAATPLVILNAADGPFKGGQYPGALTLDLAPNSTPVEQAQIAEMTLRPLLSSVGTFDGIAAIAGWAMTASEARQGLIADTVTHSRTIGKMLRQIAPDCPDPLGAFRDEYTQTFDQPLTPLFDNTQPCRLAKISSRSQGGFDFTVLTLVQQDDTGAERTLVVVNQNENLIVWDTQCSHPLGMAPDLLCLMGRLEPPVVKRIVQPLSPDEREAAQANLQGFHGLSVEDVVEGQEVFLFRLPAAPALTTGAELARFNTLLQSLGYFGPNLATHAQQGD